jgi:hypothetical protein
MRKRKFLIVLAGVTAFLGVLGVPAEATHCAGVGSFPWGQGALAGKPFFGGVISADGASMNIDTSAVTSPFPGAFQDFSVLWALYILNPYDQQNDTFVEFGLQQSGTAPIRNDYYWVESVNGVQSKNFLGMAAVGPSVQISMFWNGSSFTIKHDGISFSKTLYAGFSQGKIWTTVESTNSCNEMTQSYWNLQYRRASDARWFHWGNPTASSTVFTPELGPDANNTLGRWDPTTFWPYNLWNEYCVAVCSGY